MATVTDIDKINADFRQAQSLHKAGDVSGAAGLYETLLPLLPDHVELLYLLGAAYVHLERPAEATPHLDRALSLNPKHISALEMTGSAWTMLNDPSKALGYFRDAFHLNPTDIESACRLGTTLVTCEQYRDAIDVFEKALAITPNYPEAMTGKAFAQHRLGQSAEAETSLRRCININPSYVQAYSVLSAVLLDLENFAGAENILRNCLKACPGHPAVQHDLAITIHRQGRLPEAEQAYRDAIALGVSGPEIFVHLCDALTDLGQIGQAEELLTRALEHSPNHAGVLTGLGRIEELRGNLEEAIALHDRAEIADKNYADTFVNRGNAWKFSGDFTRALADYDAALALNPNLSAAIANRGMTFLTLGQLAEGWPAFKSRIKARAGSVDLSNSTVWDGSPLDNKNILVWAEYGLGDELLFASLIPELMVRAASCTLVCSPRLVGVFRRAFPSLTVHALGDQIDGSFDARLPLTDAAQWLRPTLESFPKHNGYIQADSELTKRLRKRYQRSHDQPLVGISWHSGSSVGTAPFKSISLERWAPILEIPNITFVSLQYGDCDDELQTFRQNTGLDIIHDSEIDTSGDMDSFTAQVAAMDLIISVSNTTVHFAGALGKPVWAMVPKGPGAHWYWFLDRTDSVWYPSLQLFRQPKRSAWDQPLSEVANQLKNWQAE